MLSIKVLGGGCKKCHTLEEVVREAVKDLELEAKVELVTDQSVITSYEVAMTPALVINETVVSSGKVLTKDKVINLIKLKG